MLYYNPDELGIGFLEVPHQVSLNIPIVGCPIHCPECHSKHNWRVEGYPNLTEDKLREILDRYQSKFTVVTFMGGEWDSDTLYKYLDLIHSLPSKTCLYTGLELEEIDKRLNIMILDYLKVGPYKSEFGGLTNPNTNQRFYQLDTIDGLIDITKEFQ